MRRPHRMPSRRRRASRGPRPDAILSSLWLSRRRPRFQIQPAAENAVTAAIVVSATPAATNTKPTLARVMNQRAGQHREFRQTGRRPLTRSRRTQPTPPNASAPQADTPKAADGIKERCETQTPRLPCRQARTTRLRRQRRNRPLPDNRPIRPLFPLRQQPSRHRLIRQVPPPQT